MKLKCNLMKTQRLTGVALILIGILSIFLSGDGTAALIFVPYGTGALITEKHIITK